MFCPNCGNQTANISFCSFCGAPLSDYVSEPPAAAPVYSAPVPGASRTSLRSSSTAVTMAIISCAIWAIACVMLMLPWLEAEHLFRGDDSVTIWRIHSELMDVIDYTGEHSFLLTIASPLPLAVLAIVSGFASILFHVVQKPQAGFTAMQFSSFAGIGLSAATLLLPFIRGISLTAALVFYFLLNLFNTILCCICSREIQKSVPPQPISGIRRFLRHGLVLLVMVWVVIASAGILYVADGQVSNSDGLVLMLILVSLIELISMCLLEYTYVFRSGRGLVSAVLLSLIIFIPIAALILFGVSIAGGRSLIWFVVEKIFRPDTFAEYQRLGTIVQIIRAFLLIVLSYLLLRLIVYRKYLDGNTNGKTPVMSTSARTVDSVPYPPAASYPSAPYPSAPYPSASYPSTPYPSAPQQPAQPNSYYHAPQDTQSGQRW